MRSFARPDPGDPRFLVDEWEPAYLGLLRSGRLGRLVEEARKELRACRACPRECGADRLAGETGVCRTAGPAVVSSAFPHFGEESVLVGRGGSGTIFFGFCNLRCVFCQNADISQRGEGDLLEPSGIAALMLRLQAAGCANINLVSPGHVVPQAIEAVAIAARAGLRLPIVYNTNGYDSI
ncbi:MAG: radical SAM protein, partial [Candidatus Eisenbacteria bacterium]